MPRNSVSAIFPLSWLHDVLLSRIRTRAERWFYEIESIQANRSIREYSAGLPKDNDCIFAKQYKLYMPGKAELKRQLAGI